MFHHFRTGSLSGIMIGSICYCYFFFFASFLADLVYRIDFIEYINSRRRQETIALQNTHNEMKNPVNLAGRKTYNNNAVYENLCVSNLWRRVFSVPIPMRSSTPRQQVRFLLGLARVQKLRFPRRPKSVAARRVNGLIPAAVRLGQVRQNVTFNCTARVRLYISHVARTLNLRNVNGFFVFFFL